METYSPDQIRETWKYVPRPPLWFVSVGLGYGDECERVKARYPKCRIVGVEPHPVIYQHHFPILLSMGGFGFNRAVTDFDDGTADLVTGDEDNRSSLYRFRDDPVTSRETFTVPTVTLDALSDTLSDTYGPFLQTYLWMDCEGSEGPALRGAAKLFGRGAVDVVNVECLSDGAAEIDGLLTGYGMTHVHSWNGSPSGEDRVYVRADLTTRKYKRRR